jgi:hypothetical protein
MKDYVKCAAQGEMCSFKGEVVIAYGADIAGSKQAEGWLYGGLYTAPIKCGEWGDPAPGLPKYCYTMMIRESTAPAIELPNQPTNIRVK